MKLIPEPGDLVMLRDPMMRVRVMSVDLARQRMTIEYRPGLNLAASFGDVLQPDLTRSLKDWTHV